MSQQKPFGIDTISVQCGYTPRNGEPRVLPIIQSTTFRYDNAEEMAKNFDLEADGYFYTRLSNPTSDAVAAKIAALEDGAGCVLTSSGQAANFFALFNIANANDHVVASAAIYGGTFNLLSVTMQKMGIETTFVPPDASHDTLMAAVRPNTKAFFGESLSNPSLSVLDIETFAKAAHTAGVPLIVDNTFPTPINCHPFAFGADIVTHSTTKYMDGHATSVGGAIVDGGHFDWNAHADRFPQLCQPDESYHGLIYTEKFGNLAYLAKIKAQLMRDLGAVPAPMNSFLLNVGLETLPLRMQKHCENAMRIAEYLRAHEKVSWVRYPGLTEDSQHALAEKYLPNGSCGVISFGMRGGREAATVLMDHLHLAAIVTHVADARTCILHPASTTHRQLTDEQLLSCGVLPEQLRISVGLEDYQDLIADLSQALDAV